jgi:CRP-like cAMP-binding protein
MKIRRDDAGDDLPKRKTYIPEKPQSVTSSVGYLTDGSWFLTQHHSMPVRHGVVPKNRNKLLASLKPDDFSLLSRYLREVPIEQGMLLEDRGERVDAVHFPQTGMISLIVEMPEDGSVEVGTVGREGGVGLTVGLGSRIASVSALVQVSGTSLCIPASRFRSLAAQSQQIRDMSIRYAELQTGQIQQTAACNALHDIPSRLSRWLLQTGDKIEGDTIPFTPEFFGKMLGGQRRTISSVAAKFEADGLIHRIGVVLNC